MAIFNTLEDLRRRENARRGYSEVKTPLIYDKALWVTSGHWEKFRENMFQIPIDDEHTYAVKPMNCPGHMLLFGSQLRSYRELPLRYAEAAPLHRNELAGALHGLTRVRYVTQDDAHIFCSQEQVDAELDGCLDYLRYLYGLFGIEPRAELSTRPDNKLGTDEEWDFTEGKLVEALERHQIEYFVGAGEGSFYGPKIDLHVTDVLQRSWQLGTIQLDAQMPARFGLTYMGAGQPRASGLRRPPGVPRLVRALHRDPDRALRRRVPALARAGAGAGARGQRAASRGGPRARRSASPRRATASRSTSATRRSASASATASSRRSRTSSSGASASPTRRSRSARAPTASRRSPSPSCSPSSRSSSQLVALGEAGHLQPLCGFPHGR